MTVLSQGHFSMSASKFKTLCAELVVCDKTVVKEVDILAKSDAASEIAQSTESVAVTAMLGTINVANSYNKRVIVVCSYGKNMYYCFEVPGQSTVAMQFNYAVLKVVMTDDSKLFDQFAPASPKFSKLIIKTSDEITKE